MKKINAEVVAKILILLGFSIFYLKIIVSNEILKYVHPRIIPFAIFGMISMFIITLFLISDIFYNNRKKFKIKNHFIFIFPLIMIIFMQSTSANSAIKGIDTNGKLNESSSNNSSSNNSNNNSPSLNSTYELYSGKSESDGQGQVDKIQLNIVNNIIEVNINNFVSSLDEILGNPKKYEGKEIEISGFVYRDKDLKENQFIIARFMMVCCAADLQVAGIECSSSDSGSYDNGTWVKIKGKIKINTSEDGIDPVIAVETIEKDPAPDTSYVYPF
ncbi:TIGR03943 family putative permease subunit [Clostridium beijerinckii]|uniref:TIGR03943 family putative permease subunit n=1 Tax=Clostridium beijerinckii TaxID=1520 RepID=UPI00232ACF8D|nr:TIGR03943 family protein [Clostridium beijerinckii]